jgi:hypothetical protein
MIMATSYFDTYPLLVEYAGFSEIPAYYDADRMDIVIGHNGLSAATDKFNNFPRMGWSDLRLFYRSDDDVRYYLYKGKVPMILGRQLDQRGNPIYSVLYVCPPETVFCVCDHCGDHFIIPSSVASMTQSKNKPLPGKYCLECYTEKHPRPASINQ